MRTVFLVVAVLALVASIAMYMLGTTSSHLTELKQFWWAPLPVAVIFLLLASRKRQ